MSASNSTGAPLSNGTGSDSAATMPAVELPADELKRRAGLSKQLMSAFGEAVSVLMRSESHRHQFIADIEWLVIPAIASGQFSIVDAQSKSIGFTQPVGLVLWARVSPEVDQRLSSNLTQPIRLKPQEWASGDILWLVEAVGDNRVMGTMLKTLSEKEWKGRRVKLRARDENGKPVVRTIEPTPTSEAGAKG